ncbi:serine hydrolase [Thermoflexus sp.]|uniref:serine hydrolase n=1 Tax=Thermoflexus sp. TaxID=1969742 RepID=UPI0035E43E4E
MLRSLNRWMAWGIVGLLVGFLVWQFVLFQQELNRIPHTWTVAGLAVGGRSIEEALDVVEQALNTPLQVHYRDRTLMLDPVDLEVRLDREKSRELLREAMAERQRPVAFLQFLFRQPPPPRDLPISVQASAERIRLWLLEVARQFDEPPEEPQPDLENFTFRPGRPGHVLNISLSAERLQAALAQAAPREMSLAVEEKPAPALSLAALGRFFEAYLQSFDGTAGIFIKDLRQGETWMRNGDLAFSGIGVMRLPVALAIARSRDLVHDEARRARVFQMLTDEAALPALQELLTDLGDGEPEQGAERTTALLRELGLVNSFIAWPFDQPGAPPAVVTPANSRPDLPTHPDPRQQTTPEDTGVLLEMLYQCARNGGPLPLVSDGAIEPAECQFILEAMAQNRLADAQGQPTLLAAGLPPGIAFARRPGWTNETRIDAGIVMAGPSDYALVVFLHRPLLMEWEEAVRMMRDLSRITAQFFLGTPRND